MDSISKSSKGYLKIDFKDSILVQKYHQYRLNLKLFKFLKNILDGNEAKMTTTLPI